MKKKDIYKFIGDYKISLNELTKEVNKMDKKFGANLKHPEIWNDPDMYIEQYQADAENSLRSIVCVINGIDPKVFVSQREGVSIKQENISNKRLTDESFVNWNSKASADTDSIAFRCKFVSLILSEIIGNVNEIVHRYVDKNTRVHHSMSEKEIIATKELVNDCVKFAIIMMNPGTSYKNIILKIIEWVSYKKKSIPQIDYNRTLVDHVIYSRNYARKDPLSGIPVYDDDESIYAIMETAFMLTTNNMYDETGYIPKFKKVSGATRKHDLLLLIEALGASIITTKKPEKMSAHFKAFVSSRPSVYSSYYKEAKENAAIQYGLYAIAYLDFIYDDDLMSRFISDMLEKGI